MKRLGRRAGFALWITAALVFASAASARTERFRWNHSDGPNVDSFQLYWGTSSGSYASSLNVGKAQIDSTGAFYFDIVVPDGDTIYAVVTAWDNGLESPRSNERVRPGITGGTSSPPPPPPTTSVPDPPTVTVSGQIVHVEAATTGATHTSGWVTVFPYDPVGNALTLGDPVSGGAFPRDVDLSPYFTQAVQATRIEVEACAANSAGYRCQNRVNVPRTGTGGGSSGTLGAPGQPFIIP